MSLTIGQVSKLLGLSSETIRFYEQQNIVNPNRNKNSNYRHYETWDIFDLLECIRYRNMKFSMKEIELLMKKENLEFLFKQVSVKCNEISETIQYNQLLLNFMEDFKEKVEAAPLNVGNFWIKKRPEFYYIVSIKRNHSTYSDFDYNDQTLVNWITKLPFVKSLMHVQIANLEENNDYNFWSVAIESKNASFLQLPVNENVHTIPSKLYLHTIINCGEKGELSIKMLEPAINHIKEKNMKICGDILGELFVRVYENGKWHRYIEIMIPIE